MIRADARITVCQLQVLDPLKIGQDVKEIIECDLAAEIGLLDAYRAEQDRRAATLKATRDDLAARSAALTVTDLRAARRLVKS